MSVRFLKIAVVYFALGVIAGIAMGMTGQFQYAPVHAHLNLLGWASLALAGLIYHLHPDAARTRLAQWHFWLHNVAMPVFMIGLALRIAGYEAADGVIRIGAVLTLVAVQMFVVNVLRSVRDRNAASSLHAFATAAAARAEQPK